MPQPNYNFPLSWRENSRYGVAFLQVPSIQVVANVHGRNGTICSHGPPVTEVRMSNALLLSGSETNMSRGTDDPGPGHPKEVAVTLLKAEPSTSRENWWRAPLKGLENRRPVQPTDPAMVSDSNCTQLTSVVVGEY